MRLGQRRVVRFRIESLQRPHPNVRYIKLEGPLIIGKLIRIRDRLDEQVSMLGGWNGLYLVESIPAEIRGVMPGLALCEVLD